MSATNTRALAEDRLIASLAALAIAIHIVEALLPSPLPGVKPGLANVVTLVALLRYGWRVAAWVTLLRVLIASLLLGAFPGPTFILSASGAGAALIALCGGLGLDRLLPGRGLTAIGLSVPASLAHMSAQLAVAGALFVPAAAAAHLAPVLLALSLIFGVVSGLIANSVLARLPAPGQIHGSG